MMQLFHMVNSDPFCGQMGWGRLQIFLVNSSLIFANVGAILEEVLMWTCFCYPALLQHSKLLTTDTAVCQCCPHVSFEQRGGCSCCLWLLVLAAVLLHKSPMRSMGGGPHLTPSHCTQPEMGGEGGGEEMHPECALGQTWVHQMLCLTTSEIWLKDNLCALLLGYKEDRDGESILQSPWFYGKAYSIRR